MSTNSAQHNHFPRCKLQVNLAKRTSIGQAQLAPLGKLSFGSYVAPCQRVLLPSVSSLPVSTKGASSYHNICDSESFIFLFVLKTFSCCWNSASCQISFSIDLQWPCLTFYVHSYKCPWEICKGQMKDYKNWWIQVNIHWVLNLFQLFLKWPWPFGGKSNERKTYHWDYAKSYTTYGKCLLKSTFNPS